MSGIEGTYSELNKPIIAVIGMGYVGLPIAIEFGKLYKVLGFDINKEKVADLNNKIDPSNEISSDQFNLKTIQFTSDPNLLADCTIFIVAVPTPVDEHHVPDLSALESACSIVGNALKKGDHVIFESTVYPGCTEDVCVPILEHTSGLKFKSEFKVGYSPERINPGDRKHSLTKVIKVVSGCDEESLKTISSLYASIVEPGVFEAKSIKVAEAAKVIENTQRDLNIALMNELAIIFDKMNINTHDVLQAARTKWNFLPFHPGLVGGHCIGVDPYYLTYKAKQLGYNPEVILSGRRINDSTPQFIARKIISAATKLKLNIAECSALIKGITFKENVSDIRRSMAVRLYHELQEFSIHVDVQDPRANIKEVKKEYAIDLIDSPSIKYDIIILAVPHDEFIISDLNEWADQMKDPIIIFDVQSKLNDLEKPKGLVYLNL